jgi:restriction system protein
MKKYNRVMLGRQSMFAGECIEKGFIGVNCGLDQDLSNDLVDDWRDFNAKFRPIWLSTRPHKKKVSAGLQCGMTWTLSKGLQIGDIVLSPDGSGSYAVGEITSGYKYVPESELQHQREVKWYPGRINRQAMSEALQNSTRSGTTMCDISQYADEIEALIEGKAPSKITSTDTTIEDASVFAMEKHLEDFLVKNWSQTELGRDYDIYADDGEVVGQQYPSDTGNLDILAVSKDNKTLLVVELKKGRASDHVVGQIQRYMGFIKSELAEDYQDVKGVIIALDDDIKIQRALSVTNNIDFYKYEVSFKLYQ